MSDLMEHCLIKLAVAGIRDTFSTSVLLIQTILVIAVIVVLHSIWTNRLLVYQNLV